MSAGFKANKKLWYGAGALFVTAFVTKQLIWTMMRDTIESKRIIEHDIATENLERAYANARKLQLSPLTAEQRAMASLMASSALSDEDKEELDDIDKV